MNFSIALVMWSNLNKLRFCHEVSPTLLFKILVVLSSMWLSLSWKKKKKLHWFMPGCYCRQWWLVYIGKKEVRSKINLYHNSGGAWKFFFLGKGFVLLLLVASQTWTSVWNNTSYKRHCLTQSLFHVFTTSIWQWLKNTKPSLHCIEIHINTWDTKLYYM